MRAITISTQVFAAIWAARRPGEETESDILERLLGLPKIKTGEVKDESKNAAGGIHNVQFGVYWPPGFEIFRTYKGDNYRAVVKDGRWFMKGEFYPSLHKLSEKVVGGRENSWMNWKYRDPHGVERLIDARRQGMA